MDLSLLMPAGFTLCGHQLTPECLTIGLIATGSVGTCPQCHSASTRVHSFYQRTLGDVPISGRRVRFLVRLRKFFCSQATCSRKVFAQCCATIVRPYGRRCQRADQHIQAIGLHTGAKPGVSLCQLTGLPVSASTILRVIKKTPLPATQTPKRLGIDDFAFRKGCQYGTILVDLDQRKPIDLLPDREGKTLEAWLQAHPGIELITRDRSAVYANAVTAACPDVVQVADRWHLLKNLSEAFERFLDTQRSAINDAVQAVNLQTSELTDAQPEPLTDLELPISPQIASPHSSPIPVPTEKRYAVYQRTKELQRAGHGIRAVSRHLGVARNTIKMYFRQEHFVPRPKPKRSNLYAYEAYLRKRWLEGETCVAVLFEEIKAQGYNGGYTILTAFLADYPRLAVEPTLPPARKGISYSSRQVSRLLSLPEPDWPAGEQAFIQELLRQSESIKLVRDLCLRFKILMETKQADGLTQWCEEAGAVSALNGFVRGLRQDYAAVEQAFSSEWSNGQTEGQVNRLKTIKRQMYGKAGFALLRLRVLFRNRTAPPD